MSARVAIYARVSTLNHGQDVSLQTRELQQFASARSWAIAGEYIDAGVSGAKDSRPELNRLMADALPRGDSTWFAYGDLIGSHARSRTYFER